MKTQYKLLWEDLSLSKKYLFAGGIVMLLAMLFIGSWVSKRIEDAVVHNSAATVALYMESFIAPLSQELASSDKLTDDVRMELSKIFNGTSVGERVVSVKIWKKNGQVIYASNEDIEGKTFTPSENLINAWEGNISASFESLTGEENQHEASLGFPLLEVYSPITEFWTGQIIAVVEFYERADELEVALVRARWSSWMVVGLSFSISGILLFKIVHAGDSTIQQQKKMLVKQLKSSQIIAKQNEFLKQRVIDASSRATAQSDRALRQIGSELHDGPAQYISLAALRLETVLPKSKEGTADAEDIKHALNTALTEIRTISRGLAVPDLDNLDVFSIIKRAISDHNKHNHQSTNIPKKILKQKHCGLGYSAKLCVYRFIQEGLSNALKHAPSSEAKVNYQIVNDSFVVTISDNGPGFNVKEALTLREDGGQGLIGLKDRAESIAGNVDIQNSNGTGTRLTLTLPFQKG